jgi:hypothetical protein
MEATGYYCTVFETCIGFVQGIPIYLDLQCKPLLYFEQTVMLVLWVRLGLKQHTILGTQGRGLRLQPQPCRRTCA